MIWNHKYNIYVIYIHNTYFFENQKIESLIYYYKIPLMQLFYAFKFKHISL